MYLRSYRMVRQTYYRCMNLLSWITNKTSLEIKSFQSGNVQQYAWVFILGVLSIVALTIYL